MNSDDIGPQLFDRTVFCDDRGHFENIVLDHPSINFEGKRIYVCSNFQQGMVRAFHYHEFEAKIFICIQGAAKFLLYKGVRYAFDAGSMAPDTFVISEKMGKAIYIPPNYANGWQSLTPDTVLLGISNKTVEESLRDDSRFLPEALSPENWETKWR